MSPDSVPTPDRETIARHAGDLGGVRAVVLDDGTERGTEIWLTHGAERRYETVFRFTRT